MTSIHLQHHQHHDQEQHEISISDLENPVSKKWVVPKSNDIVIGMDSHPGTVECLRVVDSTFTDLKGAKFNSKVTYRTIWDELRKGRTKVLVVDDMSDHGAGGPPDLLLLLEKEARVASRKERMDYFRECYNKHIVVQFPKQTDICLSNPKHQGTNDFFATIHSVVKRFTDEDYSPSVLENIEQRLDGRLFRRLVLHKPGGPKKGGWQVLTTKEREAFIRESFLNELFREDSEDFSSATSSSEEEDDPSDYRGDTSDDNDWDFDEAAYTEQQQGTTKSSTTLPTPNNPAATAALPAASQLEAVPATPAAAAAPTVTTYEPVSLPLMAAAVPANKTAVLGVSAQPEAAPEAAPAAIQGSTGRQMEKADCCSKCDCTPKFIQYNDTLFNIARALSIVGLLFTYEADYIAVNLVTCVLLQVSWWRKMNKGALIAAGVLATIASFSQLIGGITSGGGIAFVGALIMGAVATLVFVFVCKGKRFDKHYFAEENDVESPDTIHIACCTNRSCALDRQKDMPYTDRKFVLAQILSIIGSILAWVWWTILIQLVACGILQAAWFVTMPKWVFQVAVVFSVLSAASSLATAIAALAMGSEETCVEEYIEAYFAGDEDRVNRFCTVNHVAWAMAAVTSAGCMGVCASLVHNFIGSPRFERLSPTPQDPAPSIPPEVGGPPGTSNTNEQVNE